MPVSTEDRHPVRKGPSNTVERPEFLERPEFSGATRNFSEISQCEHQDIGLVGEFCRLYLLASQKRDWLQTRDLVVDAHQPTA